MGLKTIDLNIISAKDLKNVNLIGKMDVYVVVHLSDEPKSKQKTFVHQDGGTSPTWNFNMKFTIDDATAAKPGKYLTFQLKHEHTFGADKDLGEVIVPLKELLDSVNAKDPNAPQFVTYQVRTASGKAKGELKFSFKIIDMGQQVGYDSSRGVMPCGSSSSYGASAQPYPPPTGYPSPHQASAAYPPPHQESAAYPPPHQASAAYPPPQQASAAYPPPQQAYAAYPPSQEAAAAYPPPPAGYPSQSQPPTAVPYGAPPPQGYPAYDGYPPQPAGYGYPPPGAGGYPGYPPAGYAQPQKPHKGEKKKKKKGGGGGFGAGLLGGAIGGLVLGEVLDDAFDFDF